MKLPVALLRAGGARRFEIGLARLFGAYFAVGGVFLPFLPVWMADRGLTALEISLAWAVPLAVKTLAGPLLAYGVDWYGDRRRALVALALGTALCAALLYFSTGFAIILLVVTCYGVLSSAIVPLSDVYAMSGVRAGGRSYGRMRLWGSITFIAASLGAGWLVARTGAGIVVALLAAGMVLVAVAAAKLPEELDKDQDAGRDGAVPHGSVSARDALRVLAMPALLAVFAAAALLQASHAMVYALGSVHWARLGYSADIIGLLWAVGVVAEIMLFIWSTQVVGRAGPLGLLVLAGGAAVVRWGVMTLDPGLAVLIAVQCLHGITFGATHLATVHFISDTVPRRFAATAQGAYAALGSALMGLMMFGSGLLYENHAAGAYWAMAAAGVLAGAIALGLAVSRRGRVRIWF